MSVMAPVEYMPAATMNSTPTVSTPLLEKPFSVSSTGARSRVRMAVIAPRKTTTAGSLVAKSKVKVISRMASVIHASILMGLTSHRNHLNQLIVMSIASIVWPRLARPQRHLRYSCGQNLRMLRS
jgi:hypothetical protein